MRLDLKTLEQVKLMFDLHSDHSTNCNGYKNLLEMIKKEKAFDMHIVMGWVAIEEKPIPINTYVTFADKDGCITTHFTHKYEVEETNKFSKNYTHWTIIQPPCA